jgi:ABC-type transport system involved in multi-copper enzyme maturation permease subunit
MISIIRYTLITAFRDLLFIGLLGIILLAMTVSTFLGGTALTEQDQMTIAYMAGTTRLILATGLILFVCFHVKRSFDNKEIEVILSKPISRSSFIFSYWLAFAVLSIILTIPVTIFVGIFTKVNITGLIYWGLSLICEGIMVIAFALVSSLILRSAVASALSCLCFYFLSRMMGFFVAAIHNPFNTKLPSAGYIIDWICEWFLQLVSVILPRLDLFGKTSWLIYGVNNLSDVMVFPIQSLVYIPLLLAMAIFDFKRKQF